MNRVGPSTDARLAAVALRRLFRGWKQALQNAPLGEPFLLVVLAVLTGVVGGLGAVAFRYMIRYCQYFFVTLLIDRGLAVAGPLRAELHAVTPALGLLLVGVISHHFAREVKGHGVPQVLASLALRRGRIRPRVGLFGILAPAITIGAQGSVGREGPIALIGAAFGSSVGQLLRLSDQYTSLLVACGAAAGIGATFNAPIAGGLFGLEVILGSYAMGALVPVFASAVTGVVVFGAVLGDHLAMPTPAYAFGHPAGVAAMLVLGLLGGGVALAYTRGLYLMEDLFDGWRTAWPWKAVSGGLAVGLIGLLLPQVLGVGYDSMQAVVVGKYGLVLLVALLVGKYVATLLTIGAGGSGGVFAPSLYLGAVLGGAFGAVFHAILPGFAASPALYAVAGMGVVFAGAAQAPLTAMVIILEMTGDYHLTGGVVAACALSYLVYGSLARDSMYTVRLSRDGVRILRGAEVRPLQTVPITAAMEPLRVSLQVEDTVETARQVLAREAARALPVFRADGMLHGILDDLQLLQAIGAGEPDRPVGEICRTGVPVLAPSLTLDDAMRHFGSLATDLLPVGADALHILGTVSRTGVLRAYYNRTILTLETPGKIALLRDREPASEVGAFREVTLPAAWSPGGRPLGALDLLPGVVVVSIRRGAQTLIPFGESQLRAGDRVLLHTAEAPILDDAEARLLSAAPRRRGLFDYLRLPQDWAPAGQPLSALHLPVGAVVVSVQRGEGGVIVPRGETLLRAGDAVTICAEDAQALARARGVLLAAGRAVEGFRPT